MDIKLHSITKSYRGESLPAKANKDPLSVTYYKGSQEFDTYEKEIEEIEKVKQQSKEALPKNFICPSSATVNSEGIQVTQQLQGVFRQYYQGAATKRDVEQVLSNIVSDLRSTYIERGFDEAAFMPKLIEDVYNGARLYSISGAGEAGWHESKALAAAYNGHDGNTRDWIYYDSKYYYSTEDMKVSLQEIAEKIGARYGVSELDLPTSYSDNDIRKGIYSSYNTLINFNARGTSHNGNMIDEKMVPPENFSFFYKGNESGMNKYPLLPPGAAGDPDSVFDGVLHVWYDKWSCTARVPVRFNVNDNPVSLNMLDIVKKASATQVPDEITSFLKNFDFFTVVQSGKYLKSHVRRI